MFKEHACIFLGTCEIMFQYMNRLKIHMNTGGDEIW